MGSGSARGEGAGSRLNWTAVSAVAGSLAAVVALFTYLRPPVTGSDAVVSTPSAVSSPSPEPSSPDREDARPSPSPSLERSTSRPPERTRATQDTPPPLPEVRPAGCDEAATALNAYRRDAGTSGSGQAAAAQQPYRDLMGAGLSAQGVVAAKIRRLAAEFQELGFRLTGMVDADPNQVITDINTDIREFNGLCAFD
ncbi:hypothetical protein AB0K18_09370 [Nonomuraea sp. NPDC049421]|uniref:hypothetical protein n=1 Tax=Nonomuraea sp. NPDC049421 TaxID=3155275 RepID=UPI00342F7C1B